MDNNTYWLAKGQNVTGPYSFDILLIMWERNEILITDQICKNGTESWTEVSRLIQTFERAKCSKNKSQSEPETYPIILILTFLMPIIGIILAISWLTNEKYVEAAVRVLLLSVILIIVYSIALPILL